MRAKCWICESLDVYYIDPTGIASWCKSCWDLELAKARGDLT